VTRRAGRASEVIEGLLSRRIVFVTGKGATGKSTIASALALLAARAGRRVLCGRWTPRGTSPAPWARSRGVGRANPPTR